MEKIGSKKARDGLRLPMARRFEDHQALYFAVGDALQDGGQDFAMLVPAIARGDALDVVAETDRIRLLFFALPCPPPAFKLRFRPQPQ